MAGAGFSQVLLGVDFAVFVRGLALECGGKSGLEIF